MLGKKIILLMLVVLLNGMTAMAMADIKAEDGPNGVKVYHANIDGVESRIEIPVNEVCYNFDFYALKGGICNGLIPNVKVYNEDDIANQIDGENILYREECWTFVFNKDTDNGKYPAVYFSCVGRYIDAQGKAIKDYPSREVIISEPRAQIIMDIKENVVAWNKGKTKYKVMYGNKPYMYWYTHSKHNLEG
ncbi:hypothetical protein [Selenomonas ruminis]|uniref:Uncharacterized protein n=1 Tax=Selenomonas ruminis TaxID=2593411 RepID=A0A5D6W3H0_9FIRM|nr:hypothetical protein [Selenomonas sp. mPRGC5]TYZ21368.1 hypothetical protein FZ040_10155 [Selenomonas sp. mPRGC5]